MLSLAKDKEAVELTDRPSNMGVSGPCLEHVGGGKDHLGLGARGMQTEQRQCFQW